MDIVNKEHAIAPLTISITPQQKALILPINTLRKEVKEQYKKFSKEVQNLEHMASNPTQYTSTVLSQGFIIIKSLKEALDKWQLQYKKAPSELMSFLEKLNTVHQTDTVERCNMLSHQALELGSAKDRPRENPSNRSMSYQILLCLWRLKWSLHEELSKNLATINDYNRKKSLAHQSHDGLPFPFIAIPNPIESAFSGACNDPMFFMHDLQVKLSHYSCIFRVNHLDATQALEELGALSSKIYKNALGHIDCMMGSAPKHLEHECKMVSDTLLSNINTQIEKTKKGWDNIRASKGSLLPSAYDLHLPLAQVKLPFADFEKMVQKNIREVFSEHSFATSFEKAVMRCLNAVDEKVYELIRQYATAVYCWNHSKLLRELKLNQLTLPQDQFTKMLEQAKQIIEVLVNSVMKDFIESLQKIDSQRLRITPTEQALLKRIESMCFTIRKKYNRTVFIFKDFSQQLEKGAHVLSAGPFMIDELKKSHISQEIAQYNESIKQAILRLRNPEGERKTYYWIHEMLSKEHIQKAIQNQQRDVKAKFVPFRQTGIYAFQKRILDALLDLISESDSLFYRYTDWIKNALSNECISVSASQFCSITQTLMVQLEHYKKLFYISYPEHLVGMNKLFDLNQLALENYHYVKRKDQQVIIDLRARCDFLQGLIQSLQKYQMLSISTSHAVPCRYTPEDTQVRFFNQLRQAKHISSSKENFRVSGGKNSDSFQQAKQTAMDSWLHILNSLEELLKEFAMHAIQKNYKKHVAHYQAGPSSFSSSCNDMLSNKMTEISNFVIEKRSELALTHQRFAQQVKAARKKDVGEVIVAYNFFLCNEEEDLAKESNKKRKLPTSTTNNEKAFKHKK